MTRIKAVALDVDGVLTDGTFWWGPNGEEFKRFCFVDIMGISQASKAGIIFALISGEAGPLIDRFAEKMRIVDIHKDCKDKAAALRLFAQQHDLHLSEICFMGDDINDLAALEIAGLAAAPANGHTTVLKKVAFVSRRNGGNGAVRELLDFLNESPPRKDSVGTSSEAL